MNKLKIFNRFCSEFICVFCLFIFFACSDNSADGGDEEKITYATTGLPVVYIDTFSGLEIASKDLYEDATVEIVDEFLPSSVAKDMMIEYLYAKWAFISANIDNL